MKKDETFSAYLVKNKIVIDHIPNYTDEDKRPTVRKIQFIAHLRNYYRKTDALASRKRAPDSYAGFSNLCQAMEYNPRMLIGLMNRFIPAAKTGKPISISFQIKCLGDSFRSYKALLGTISISSEDDFHSTIYDLIETIAELFKAQIIGEKFNPEAKGTLTFKKDENVAYLEAVGVALNAGALIVDRDSEDAFHNFNDIRKARCRLSYLFSHHFGLLTMKPRGIELINLLKKDHSSLAKLEVIDPAKQDGTYQYKLKLS